VNPGRGAVTHLGQGGITVTNEGTLDRFIRIVIGIALLSLTVAGPKSMVGLVGIVPIVTGLVGFCPLYRLMGVSTCPVSQRR
jgi:Protein of unknown function (DUF2892)